MNTKSKSSFKSIQPEEVLKNETGETLYDLYIHLPTADRFVKYVAVGDSLSETKIAALQTHVSPELYYDPDALESTDMSLPKTEVTNGNSVENDDSVTRIKPDFFKDEVIGIQATEKLKGMFTQLIKGDGADPAATLTYIEGMTDGIIQEVAPESKQLKEYLLKHAAHVDIMNDSSAITTLAVLFALANDFDSRKSYKELTYAALIMDVGMMELSDEEIFLYYTDKEKLSAEVWKRIKNHPIKSHQLATEKLASLSESTLQLILTHHELFSGKGFPRSVRTESLFPMARVLALAVDVFEKLKAAELLKQRKSIIEVLEELETEAPEPHLRRHNKKLVDMSIEFLKANGLQGAGENTAAESPNEPSASS